MSEILSHPWFVWTIAAAVFALFEMLLPHFGLIFAAIAALIAALASLRLDFLYQGLIFGVAVLIGVFLLRPRLVKKLQTKQHMPTRTEQLLGKKAKVCERIDSAKGTGRVELEGNDWSARSDEPLAVGTTVVIESTDGIVVIVRKVSH